MLRGRKALITGASRGIGKGIAQAFIRRGARVIITGRDEEALRLTCDELGPNATFFCWNVEDISNVYQNIEQIARMIDGLDIVVNNAGILVHNDWKKCFFDLTVEEWNQTLNTNLRSVFFICQASAAYMISHKIKGHILNICSEMAFQPVFTSYGISKWGIRGLTQGLGLLLGPEGIIVNGIAPGPTATEMMHWKQGQSIECLKHPNGRWGTVEEIGELAVFLTCGKGDNIVGQCIVSDGGHVLIGRGQGPL